MSTSLWAPMHYSPTPYGFNYKKWDSPPRFRKRVGGSSSSPPSRDDIIRSKRFGISPNGKDNNNGRGGSLRNSNSTFSLPPIVQELQSPSTEQQTSSLQLFQRPLSFTQYQHVLFERGIEYVNLLSRSTNPPTQPSYTAYLMERRQQVEKEDNTQRGRISDDDLTYRLKLLAECAAQAVKECSMDIEEEGSKRPGPSQQVVLAARQKPLDSEIRKKIINLLERSGGNNGQIVIDKFSIDMTREKIVCLREYTWLNDEVINFYMCMLQERDKALCEKYTGRKPSHYFNSFFMTKLQEGGKYAYSQVRRWSRKFDVFALEKVFIPINIHNTHWTLAVVYMQEKKIVFYDSMSGGGMVYLRDLKRWVADEHRDKKGTDLDMSSWTTMSAQGIPQQRNGYDCGVFVVMCADYLTDDLPLTYRQEEMSENRLKIAASIEQGNLSYPT
eukprot:gene2907-3173_t